MHMLTLASILVATTACDSGCGTPAASNAENATVDCTLQSGAQIVAVYDSFKPPAGQKIDWGKVESAAKAAGETIGGCALAQFVQDYLSNKGAAPSSAQDGQLAKQTLEDFRATVAGGATFKVNVGGKVKGL